MIYEELTNELLEAMKGCDRKCDRCAASSICDVGVFLAISKPATALLEERAKPKVWDGAPDNAYRSIVNWYDKSRGFIKSKVLTRELPKTRARQIAEKEGHRLAEIHGWNAAGKELVTNAMESAINKYAEELERENRARDYSKNN